MAAPIKTTGNDNWALPQQNRWKRHSRSSEKKSSAMKSEATSVMAPPADVRLKNSAASSRCIRGEGRHDGAGLVAAAREATG